MIRTLAFSLVILPSLAEQQFHCSFRIAGVKEGTAARAAWGVPCRSSSQHLTSGRSYLARKRNMLQRESWQAGATVSARHERLETDPWGSLIPDRHLAHDGDSYPLHAHRYRSPTDRAHADVHLLPRVASLLSTLPCSPQPAADHFRSHRTEFRGGPRLVPTYYWRI